MNFKLHIVIPKDKKPRSNTVNSNVVEKNVEGIIISHSSTGELKVISKNIIYNIHINCFNTKGKRYVYVKDDLGHWIMYDRPAKDDRRPMPKCYMPFKDKLNCKGDLVRYDNNIVFYIKASWNETNVEQYEEAMKLLEGEEKSVDNDSDN